MIISLCIALLCIPSITYSGHLQKNAQQMHSKINFLLQNLDQFVPHELPPVRVTRTFAKF